MRVVIEAKPYLMQIHAVIGSRKEAQQWVMDRAPVEQVDELVDVLERCEGITMTLGMERGTAMMLWAPSVTQSAILYHEALHAAMAILDTVGVTISGEEQEPLAYLQGQIVKDITDAIKDARKQRHSAKGTDSDSATAVSVEAAHSVRFTSAEQAGITACQSTSR